MRLHTTLQQATWLTCPNAVEIEQRHLYHIYWSLPRKVSLKKTPLLVCKILRLFVNTFFADHRYSLLNRENLMRLIHTQLSERQKTFSRFFFFFFFAFFKSRSNFQHFQKKMTLIANVFTKLPTAKNVVR